MQFGYFTSLIPPAYGTRRRNPQQFLREVLNEALLAGHSASTLSGCRSTILVCLAACPRQPCLAHVAAETTASSWPRPPCCCPVTSQYA